MPTKKKSAGSSQVKSKGGKSVTAAGHGGVLRTNGIVAEQAVASDRPLTTNQGVHIANHQNTLKVGLRGPSLLEDFIRREKSSILITTASRNVSFMHGVQLPTEPSKSVTISARAPLALRPSPKKEKSRRCSRAFPQWLANAV